MIYRGKRIQSLDKDDFSFNLLGEKKELTTWRINLSIPKRHRPKELEFHCNQIFLLIE